MDHLRCVMVPQVPFQAWPTNRTKPSRVPTKPAFLVTAHRGKQLEYRGNALPMTERLSRRPGPRHATANTLRSVVLGKASWKRFLEILPDALTLSPHSPYPQHTVPFNAIRTDGALGRTASARPAPPRPDVVSAHHPTLSPCAAAAANEATAGRSPPERRGRRRSVHVDSQFIKFCHRVARFSRPLSPAGRDSTGPFSIKDALHSPRTRSPSAALASRHAPRSRDQSHQDSCSILLHIYYTRA